MICTFIQPPPLTPDSPAPPPPPDDKSVFISDIASLFLQTRPVFPNRRFRERRERCPADWAGTPPVGGAWSDVTLLPAFRDHSNDGGGGGASGAPRRCFMSQAPLLDARG